MAAAARLLNQPLAFQSASAPLGTDLAQLRSISRQAVPVQRLRAVGGADGFAYRAASQRLSDLHLVACANAPLEVEVAQRRRAVVVLPFGGQGECLQQEQRLPISGQTGLLILTGAPYRVHCDYLNSVFFCLDIRRLRRTAKAMTPFGIEAPLLDQRIHSPQWLRGDHPLEAELLRQLRRSIALLDLPLLSGSPLFGAQGIDELIYRQLVQLLCLSAPATPATTHEQGRLLQEHVLYELQVWIQANLHLPLRMADLERQSTYSARVLQTAFRRRCGCSPMQWVRSVRMARALELLDQPQPHTTVATAAEACGYANRAAFSRDFQQTHLQCPSHVLRRARLRQRQADSTAACAAGAT